MLGPKVHDKRFLHRQAEDLPMAGGAFGSCPESGQNPFPACLSLPSFSQEGDL